MKIPDEIVKVFQKAGITDYALEHGGKHPKVRFTHMGKRGMVVLCGTAGDWRSNMNNAKYLRREIARCASS